MDIVLILAVVCVIVILLFDLTNGFHDASNMIATVVASRAMREIYRHLSHAADRLARVSELLHDIVVKLV